MRQAKIIAVANQKGGTGKTTIAVHLAGAAGKRGFKTLIIDADPQESALSWVGMAANGQAFPAAIAGMSKLGGKIHTQIQRWAPDYDMIVIDCPPAAENPVSQAAIICSDLVVVPIMPSGLDVEAAERLKATYDAAASMREAAGGDPLRSLVVVSRKPPFGTVADVCIRDMKEIGFPMARIAVGQSVAFSEAFTLGCLVHDIPDSKKRAGPRMQIEALLDEILAIVGMAATADAA